MGDLVELQENQVMVPDPDGKVTEHGHDDDDDDDDSEMPHPDSPLRIEKEKPFTSQYRFGNIMIAESQAA